MWPAGIDPLRGPRGSGRDDPSAARRGGESQHQETQRHHIGVLRDTDETHGLDSIAAPARSRLQCRRQRRAPPSAHGIARRVLGRAKAAPE